MSYHFSFPIHLFKYWVYLFIAMFKPGLTEETRRSIGEAAVRAAKAVNYVGAGKRRAPPDGQIQISSSNSAH